ncbi:MAG TPA: DNA polymerase III subunit alpha [Bacteroidales bacterium]|nr:DNA polymerase III subunit alpha [Bacteroidales bacterium]
MFIIFDTETTGLPKNWNAPLSDLDNWPRMVQLAWQIHDEKGIYISNKNYIIKPEGYEIPYATAKIHGITTEKAHALGHDLSTVLDEFSADVAKASFIIGHNVKFDISIVGAELLRKNKQNILESAKYIDTIEDATAYCKIPGKGSSYKFPKLGELYQILFNDTFSEAHNASADVNATARCFLEMIRLQLISHPYFKDPAFSQAFIKTHPKTIELASINLESNFEPLQTENTPLLESTNTDSQEFNGEKTFVHLHVHSQYSILDGAASIGSLVKKAKKDNMLALALTDHGNMHGIKEFHAACKKEGIKPILGCEAYIVQDLSVEKDKSNHHIILLAKNLQGYKNLLKLISIANLKGYYYRPRIDKSLLETYKDGLIVSSACLGGEVSRTLMEEGVEAAEKVILWYKKIFGDDYYLEIMRHPSKDEKLRREIFDNQNYVNGELLKLAKKHNIELIATNDVHFTNKDEATAHDLLICLNTGADVNDPKRMRYTREEWFKTTEEMYSLWADMPHVLQNTSKLAEKVEEYKLDSQPIMPEFPIPEEFGTIDTYATKFSEELLQKEFERYKDLGGYESVLRIKFESDYLEYLTKLGATKRYGETPEQSTLERIDFELNTIKQMGFPGYFLIVQDFIAQARSMGVLVGPGRGSAAGAVVSYCLGITNIDPIRYDLLFERFLNPDRISMPDIDIDFDDDGRQRVLDWVVEKYGHDRVAHICTFGTMAAKSALKDVARVLKLPLAEANRMTKEFPDNGKLDGAYAKVLELEKETGSLQKAIENIQAQKKKAIQEQKDKDILSCDVQLFIAQELVSARKENNQTEIETIANACILEGSVRQAGVHACGILIGKNPLDEHIPLMPTKDEAMLSTQYDGRFVESIGLLKMDFLGLRTLTIIKEAIANIRLSTGTDLDIDAVDFADKKTFELFGKGETTAIFQFESPGMKKHLRALKPNRFEDLVAMNALYRPGPMEYIPDYIARKNGTQKVEYDHPLMEKYLQDTYGITVFQEQVMLLSRELANFTRGDSDVLRKAMGKKQIDVMNKLKLQFHDGCLANPKFIEGCKQTNKNPEDLIEKIWKDWEAFAQYAFNKSHSVCYAYIAYQTGFLKAHYPAEFMAAALSSNLSKADEISKLMEECSRMGMQVLVPDVNESQNNFAVNKKGQIRFGLGAIKGVGESASQTIISERTNGLFIDIFDFVSRMNLRTVNKKNLESLALSGAFDSFGIERHRFFSESETETSFIETLLKFGNASQTSPEPNMMSLFGNDEIAVEKPTIPNPARWSNMEYLRREKEHIGIYLSAHPLDEYKMLINAFCKYSLNELDDISKFLDKDFTIAGMVTKVLHLETKTGKPYSKFTLDDFNGSHEFALFGKDHAEYTPYIIMGEKLAISIKVERNKFKENSEYEYKIKKIEPLDSLKDKIKQITLQINVNNINDHIIQEINQLAESDESKGLPLTFMIYDRKDNISLTLKSKNMRVELNSDFIEYVLNHENIDYKLN